MNAVRMRFDALHLPWKALGHAWPVMRFPIRVNEGDISVRIDDTGHSQILIDALPTALVFGFHLGCDFQTMFLQRAVRQLPQFSAFSTLRCFVFPRIKADIHNGCRGFCCNL